MSAPGQPLESALDELYGVEPAEFVEVRKRLTRDLRAAGEVEEAKTLQAARRPTTAAWALNQLSRHEPARVESFLDRSRELEAAQLGRSGGREAIREATRNQRAALAAAADAALARLGSRATDAYRSQILATLHAASADDAVGEQLRKGRLIRELAGVSGFPDSPGLTLVPDLPDSEPTHDERPTKRDAKKGPPASETAAELRKQEREREAEERAERRRAEAEAAAQAAQDQVVEAEGEATAAQRRVDELEQNLERARRELRGARDRAERARREAARLARAVTKLE